MQHFDILYVGNDDLVWNLLQEITLENDLTILKAVHLNDLNAIKDDISFTLVLSELHLDYNYEGFSITKLGLKYSNLVILVDELSEDSIIVSDYLYGNQDKYLILKNADIVFSFLKSNPPLVHIAQVSMEA